MSDQDVQTLAAASGQRLIREFADKYANLRERSRRVPIADAKKIADEYSCPLEIGIVAYLINLDGIMGIREAVNLLSSELQRRTNVGEDVPNLGGNILEFSLLEGRWIEYIYGTFVRELELKTRELANLEASIDVETPPIEKVVSVVNSRSRLAETFVSPAVQTWLGEHVKSNTEDVLTAFCLAVTKWKLATLKGKMLQLRRRNQAFFRRLKVILATASESATVDVVMKRIDDTIQALGADLSRMSVSSVAHFILHIAPRPMGRGDRSRYVDVGMSSTRGNKTEPDMTSPFDFLERDVQLARRRTDAERSEYLSQRISRVMRVLRYQGNTTAQVVEKCVLELRNRLHIDEASAAGVIERSRQELANTPSDRQDEIAVKLVFEYISTYALER